MTSSNKTTHLPGFNVDLSPDGSHTYPNLEANFARPLTTTREFDMQRAMNSITDKPDWTKKVNDVPAIRLSVREVQQYTALPHSKTILKLIY